MRQAALALALTVGVAFAQSHDERFSYLLRDQGEWTDVTCQNLDEENYASWPEHTACYRYDGRRESARLHLDYAVTKREVLDGQDVGWLRPWTRNDSGQLVRPFDWAGTRYLALLPPIPGADDEAALLLYPLGE